MTQEINLYETWVVTDRIKKKKKKKKQKIKGGRRQNRKLQRTPEFSLAHDPQRATEGWDATELNPDLQPPKNDLQRTKTSEKRRGTEKSDETPAMPNHTKSTSKSPFYATKVIPEPFSRGVHGPGWVGLGNFFLPNPKVQVGWIGNPTQPETFHNPTQPSIFGLGSSWDVNFFFLILFIHNL